MRTFKGKHFIMLEINKIQCAVLLDGAYFFFSVNKKRTTAAIRLRRDKPEYIRELQATIGGSMGMTKNGYYWQVAGKTVTGVLISVLPYLREKVEHAQILLQFNELVANKKGFKNRALTDEERSQRQVLIDRINTLNSRKGIILE